MAWHSTWSRMRGVGKTRTWMTWGEFDGLLRQLGLTMSYYHAMRALKTKPPEKVAGAKRFEECHVQLAAEYARGKGWYE